MIELRGDLIQVMKVMRPVYIDEFYVLEDSSLLVRKDFRAFQHVGAYDHSEIISGNKAASRKR